MNSLKNYQLALSKYTKPCKWCQRSLSALPIEMYDHDGGYAVEGKKEKQWLFVTCGCAYQWSFWKLGINELKSAKGGEIQQTKILNMELHILFQTDKHQSKSSRVLCGVFESYDLAMEAASDNDLFIDDAHVVIVPLTLNQFQEA